MTTERERQLAIASAPIPGVVERLQRDNARLARARAKVDAPEPPVAKLRTFRTINLADCLERGPQWLVQRLVEQSGVSAVTGEPGSAKTFFLIDLALHIAAGRDWFGRKVQRGAVIYIAAEAAVSVQRRAALARRVKFGGADLPVKIVNEPALLGDEIYSTSDLAALQRLIAEVAEEFGMPVVAVIVDTIAASMGSGNENLDGMQRLVGAANQIAVMTGVAVVLNHHPNSTGGTLRGHTSLRGTISHGLQIEVEGDTRVVQAFKQRDAESGRLFAYTLSVHKLAQPDNFGDQATSCVVEPVEVPEPATGQDLAEQTRLTLAVRDLFANIAPTGNLVRFGEIVDGCATSCTFMADKGPDAARKAVSRALRTLTEAGVLHRCKVPRGHYRLTEDARK